MPSIYDDPGYLFSGMGTQAQMEGDLNAQRMRNALAQEKARAIEMQLGEEEAFDPTRRAIEARQGDLAYERLQPMGARRSIEADYQDPRFMDARSGASSTVPGARAIEQDPGTHFAIEKDFGPTKDDPMGGTTVGEYLTYGRQRGLIDAKEQAKSRTEGDVRTEYAQRIAQIDSGEQAAKAKAERIPDPEARAAAVSEIGTRANRERDALNTAFGISRRIGSGELYKELGGI
jgi:hypothetical protein